MDEKLNANAMGMRMAGIAGRGDATTQLTAGGLSLQARFPDREGRFGCLGWFDGLGWLDFSSLLDGFCRFDFFGSGFLGFNAETFAEPAGDFLDDLRQPLDG
jgi:hypothetical protein